MQQDTAYEDAWLEGDGEPPLGDAIEAAKKKARDEARLEYEQAHAELDGEDEAEDEEGEQK